MRSEVMDVTNTHTLRFTLALLAVLGVLALSMCGATNVAHASEATDEIITVDFTDAPASSTPLAHALIAAGFTSQVGDACECLTGPRSVAQAMSAVVLWEDQYPGGAAVYYLDGTSAECTDAQLGRACTPADADAMRGSRYV